MLMQLLLFASKAIIFLVIALLLVIGIAAIVTRGKERLRGRLTIKKLNEKYKENKLLLLGAILPKDKYKKFLKNEKSNNKKKIKLHEKPKSTIFVLNFNGDIRASAVAALREEITAILNVATSNDEVIVKVESPGGMVHAYGLAAAQLMRLRDRNISLTVIVDKVAASGGYLMACIANKILAAPFAIIGSIGVIVQIPNFNRLLKEKNIDFEQLTAGSFKRTLTMFGHNTDEGREKMRQEIEEIHQLFKNTILEHRSQLDIHKVSTGEHWLGTQALELKLVDGLSTSDDYLLEKSKDNEIFEITFHMKKSLGERFSAAASLFKNDLGKTDIYFG